MEEDTQKSSGPDPQQPEPPATKQAEPPETKQSEPPETKQSPDAMRATLWTRRRMITLLSSLAGGLLVVRYWPKPSTENPENSQLNGPHDPRFKRHKIPALFAPVSLQSGFYALVPAPRPAVRSKASSEPRIATRSVTPKTIIHYVDSKNRALFVRELNQKELRPPQPGEVELNAPTVHVYRKRASAIFEMAALEKIAKNQYSEACSLLVAGIKHDLALKGNNGGGPSLRLFDLLAKVAVRREDSQHLQELLTLAEKAKPLMSGQMKPPARRRKKSATNAPSPVGEAVPAKQRKTPKEAFDIRIEKWKDPFSAWQKRILVPTESVIWKISQPPDTTNGKSVRGEFEIKSAKSESQQTD